jgi:MFS family permease
MATGCLLLSGGFIAASFAHTIWYLYLTQGILVGLGVGFTYIPSVPIIPQWFERKRSLATGISAAGSGIGGLMYSFLTDVMITKISLAWAFRVTAVISGVFLILATILIRTRNEVIQPPQRGFDVQLLRRKDCILLLLWAFISMLGYMVILFSLPDFARSIGLSAKQASIVNAILNLGTAIGRPMIGVASDYFGRVNVAGVLTCLCGVLTLVLWLPATSYGLLLFFALINGGIFGVFWMVLRSNFSIKVDRKLT